MRVPTPWAALIVALVAVLPHAGTLWHEPVLDDPPLLAEVARLERQGGLARIVTADFRLAPTVALGYYRPVVLLSVWLDGRLGLPLPAAHHVTNLALHALCAALVFLVTHALLRAPGAAALAGLLFAVHPVHTEAIAPIAGRTDLWATAFVLLATLAWARGAAESRAATALPLLTGAVAVALGALSKEVALLAPAVLAAWHGLLPRDRGGWREAVSSGRAWALAWGGGLLVALALRWLALGAEPSPALSPGPVRAGLVLDVLARYLRLLVVPWPLNAFYLPEHVALDAASAVAALAVLAGAAALATRAARRVGLLAMIWIVVFLLPVSGLRPLPSAVLAERFLYLPSAGFCLLAGLALDRCRIWTGRRWPAALAAGLLVVAGGALSAVRTGDWRDPLRFHATLVRTAPRYAGAHEGLGHALERLGRHPEALAAYAEALRLDPGRASAHNSLGALLANADAHEDAAPHFRRAIALDPRLVEARLNLGVACVVLRDRACVDEQRRALAGLDPAASARLGAIADEAERRAGSGARGR